MCYFSFLLAIIFLGAHSVGYTASDGMLCVDQRLVELDKRLDQIMNNLNLTERKLNAVDDSLQKIIKKIPYVIVAGIILVAASYYLNSINRQKQDQEQE